MSTRIKGDKPLPRYFLDKYNMVGYMAFTILFALVYLNLYIPFSEGAWFNMGDSVLFTYTVGYFAATIAFLIVSRIIMYQCKFHFRFTLYLYYLWCIAEAVVVALLYGLFTLEVGKSEGYTFGQLFGHGLINSTICILIPYIISGLYIGLIDRDRRIRIMRYYSVPSEDSVSKTPTVETKFTIFDSSGTVRLSVTADHLYYIESDDNYIKVWYTDSKGDLKNYLVRCRLKTVEETFQGTSLIRCNRKYLVNTDKVKVLRKDTDGYYLDLGNENIPDLPVTKTYEKEILARF